MDTLFGAFSTPKFSRAFCLHTPKPCDPDNCNDANRADAAFERTSTAANSNQTLVVVHFLRAPSAAVFIDVHRPTSCGSLLFFVGLTRAVNYPGHRVWRVQKAHGKKTEKGCPFIVDINGILTYLDFVCINFVSTFHMLTQFVHNKIN